jgi:hypothetical protein
MISMKLRPITEQNNVRIFFDMGALPEVRFFGLHKRNTAIPDLWQEKLICTGVPPWASLFARLGSRRDARNDHPNNITKAAPGHRTSE